MLHVLLLTLGLLSFSFTTFAQEKDERDIPIAVSIFGPVSSNLGAYNRSNNSFCLGLINCPSLDARMLTAAYGYNHVYRDMNGISIALFGNYIANQGDGWELSLLGNINGGRFSGMQLGVANITGDEMNGLQVGLLNYAHGSTYGLQLSALNITGGISHGTQMGFVNYSGEGTRGFQLSLLNASVGETVGFQAAVLGNYSHGPVTGLQLGFINFTAGDDNNAPMAVQFGIINMSNQSRVIPIGLFNFVRGGRFDIEWNRDVLGFNEVSLVTGSQYFYSILGLESRSLNRGKSGDYHPSKSNLTINGLGLALPIKQSFIRFEQIINAPTNYRRDRILYRRILGEFSPVPYFSYHVGLEQINFYEDANDRSPIFNSYSRQVYSLTAGVALKLLSLWKPVSGNTEYN